MNWREAASTQNRIQEGIKTATSEPQTCLQEQTIDIAAIQIQYTFIEVSFKEILWQSVSI